MKFRFGMSINTPDSHPELAAEPLHDSGRPLSPIDVSD